MELRQALMVKAIAAVPAGQFWGGAIEIVPQAIGGLGNEGSHRRRAQGDSLLSCHGLQGLPKGLGTFINKALTLGAIVPLKPYR